MTEKELVEAVLKHTSTAAQLVADYKEDSTVADELYHSLLSIMTNANRWLLVYNPKVKCLRPPKK